MANSELSNLPAVSTPASGDIFYIVDVSDTSESVAGTSKSITFANLTANITSGLAASGANSDITSLAGLTTPLTVAQGGTGAVTLTGLVVGNGTGAFTVVTAPSGTVVGTTDTQTLTNKRVTPRVITTTDDATAVIDTDITDVYELSAVANATEFTLTGTPVDGQKLIVRAKDAGVGKGLTWTGFTAIGVTLPTTTVASKWHIVGSIYNSAASQWQVVAVVAEA